MEKIDKIDFYDSITYEIIVIDPVLEGIHVPAPNVTTFKIRYKSSYVNDIYTTTVFVSNELLNQLIENKEIDMVAKMHQDEFYNAALKLTSERNQ
jgi:hypothetical protein